MNRKKEIIEKATSLFKRKGFTIVTMRMLAEEIGIKASSLYNHISSKQEILSIIILDTANRFTDGMRIILESDSNSIEKLKKIILLHIEITIDNPNSVELLQNNWMYLEGANLDNYKKLRNTYEENLRNIIKDGIKCGQIRDVNPEIIIYTLLASLRSLFIWYPRQNNIDPSNLIEDISSIFLEGVASAPTR